ncbi:MAG: hypothetical protein LBT43_06675 [Prevotella sp.]|jgi:hypothetical protein|nr:hypothetical protein [Prevotella sp.]
MIDKLPIRIINMATFSFVNFPASGVKSGLDNIFHSVAKYVVGKFPHRVIRAYFVDTRDKMRNIYMNLYPSVAGDKNHTLPSNVQEIRKIERPHLYIGYTVESFDTTETGLGEFPLLFYPNAYSFDEQMASVFPILRDRDRKITLGTYNLRIRVTAEFLFSCQNKEEQITIYVYLKNFIKEKYGHILDNVMTKFTFPEAVVMSLKNILYGKDVPLSDIDNDLELYLRKQSNDGILPVWQAGREGSKYYELAYTYSGIRFQLTGAIQLDDGDKREMAYDNYTIRFPAIVEFYVPISYVLKCPELIPSAIGRPNLVDDYLVMDPVPDSDNNIQLLKIIKKYKDEARRCFIDKKYYLVARDEYSLETKDDYYNIRVAFDKEYLEIFNVLRPDERKACHKVYVYEDDALLDENTYYTIDYDKWCVYIKDGEINKLQMIEIYADVDLVNIFLERRKRRDRILAKEKIK